MRTAKGFTLIELLVVIAIIGILATIVMVSLSGAKSKARDAKRQADLKSIQLALSLYYNDNGMYPKNIYCTGTVAPCGAAAPLNGLAPTYLPTVPNDPNNSGTCTNSSGSGCYKYAPYGISSGSCNGTTNPPATYHLGAAVEDTSGAAAANDVDADTGGAYIYAVNACLGVTGGGAFNGNASGCTGTTAASPDACYDVAP